MSRWASTAWTCNRAAEKPALLAGITRNPEDCALSYTLGAGNSNQPSSISASECLPFSSSTPGYTDDLCSDRQPCLDGTVACNASSTVPPGLLPGYYWCSL